MKYSGVSRGLEGPWAHYSPALLPYPDGADIIPEHAFLFRLAQTKGILLHWTLAYAIGKHEELPPSAAPST